MKKILNFIIIALVVIFLEKWSYFIGVKVMGNLTVCKSEWHVPYTYMNLDNPTDMRELAFPEADEIEADRILDRISEGSYVEKRRLSAAESEEFLEILKKKYKTALNASKSHRPSQFNYPSSLNYALDSQVELDDGLCIKKYRDIFIYRWLNLPVDFTSDDTFFVGTDNNLYIISNNIVMFFYKGGGKYYSVSIYLLNDSDGTSK